MNELTNFEGIVYIINLILYIFWIVNTPLLVAQRTQVIQQS